MQTREVEYVDLTDCITYSKENRVFEIYPFTGPALIQASVETNE